MFRLVSLLSVISDFCSLHFKQTKIVCKGKETETHTKIMEKKITIKSVYCEERNTPTQTAHIYALKCLTLKMCVGKRNKQIHTPTDFQFSNQKRREKKRVRY